MSIAVSTVVRPSRLLIAMVSVMSLATIGVGIAIGLAYIGHFPAPLPLILSSTHILLALWALYCTVRSRKTHRIDISGIGQIRLKEDNTSASFSSLPDFQAHDAVEVDLMPNSTLWPGVLVLRFKMANEQIVTVPILPDSINQWELRTLTVACRWIAAHNDSPKLGTLGYP